jgi:hypothetical protein
MINRCYNYLKFLKNGRNKSLYAYTLRTKFLFMLQIYGLDEKFVHNRKEGRDYQIRYR